MIRRLMLQGSGSALQELASSLHLLLVLHHELHSCMPSTQCMCRPIMRSCAWKRSSAQHAKQQSGGTPSGRAGSRPCRAQCLGSSRPTSTTGATLRRGKRVSGRVSGTSLALTWLQAMARARLAPPADEEGRPEAPVGSLVPGQLQAYKYHGATLRRRRRASGLVSGTSLA